MDELENRIALIKDKREQINKNEQDKANAEISERAQLFEQIKDLRGRIANVIVVGNSLLENGFLSPINQFTREEKPLARYGYDHTMYADGFYHHVGFMYGYGLKGPIRWLGIRMGGACGAYDLYTDGEEMLSLAGETKRRQEVPIKHIKQFLAEFPLFEKALYAWIDDGMKK